MRGVIAFYTSEDIPGTNSFTPINKIFHIVNEEVLVADNKVKYFNQPIGIIVAETERQAIRAAKRVKIVYKNTRIPVLTLEQAKKDSNRITPDATVPSSDRGTNVQKVLKGGSNIFGQYHYMMETHVCVVRPTDDGLEVNSATQWMDMVQRAIGDALKIDENRFEFKQYIIFRN